MDSGTIDASSGIPAADTLTARSGTVTLSDGAALNLLATQGSTPFHDLSINASGSVNLNSRVVQDTQTIYAVGHLTLSSYVVQGGNQVSIAAGSTVTALSTATNYGETRFSGPGTLDLEGPLSEDPGGTTIIDAGAVVGNATLSLPGPCTIGSPVAQGITVDLTYPGSALTLEQPQQFQGLIADTATGAYSYDERINLEGLQAANYAYQNNLLTLYDASGSVLDTLGLQTSRTLTVTQMPGGIAVTSGDSSRAPSGVTLPVHAAAPAASSADPNPTLVSSGRSGSADPPAQAAGAASALLPSFTGSDLTTGQSLDAGGNKYTNLSQDNLNISANVPDVFITVGAGNNIISATAGGNNVLVSTGGQVNVLTGGSGTDAFFLDASSSSVTWDTIAGFHKGDFAVIAGITPQSIAANARDGLGIPGDSGLTLETYQNGGAAFVTLAGYSTSDLSDGRLGIGFGTDPTNGKGFMLVVGH